MAARQGARDADRQRSAEGRLREPDRLAAAVCNHRVACAACRRQPSAGAGAHAEIQRELRRLYSIAGAGESRYLQDHLVIRRLDRCRAGRAAGAIAHLDRCQGLRRRAQERQIRTGSRAFHRAAQRHRSRQRRPRDQQRVSERSALLRKSTEGALALLFERVGDLEAHLGLALDVVERHIGRKLDQGQPTAVSIEREHAEIGDHHIDDAGAGERQRAAVL